MYAVASSNVTSIDTHPFQQITPYHDTKYEVAWCYLHGEPRSCFTQRLLRELNDWFGFLHNNADAAGIKYHVIASNVPGVFNLGGDLELLKRLAQINDRAGFAKYGRACIDALYANICHFGQDVTTISLVQGDALGGGFEAALSSDILVAEKGARMGFPEILFNLFPGMGAYSLLSRKLGPKRAEQMILSGNVYQAQELYEMGLVDILVEDGEGEMAVYEYIRRENRARNGFRAFRRVRDYANPITLEELMAIVDAWVEAALRLGPRDLRMMERLVARQHHKRSEPDRLIQQAPRRTAKPGKDIELHSGPGAETPSALSAYEA
jgi:DSF synthase